MALLKNYMQIHEAVHVFFLYVPLKPPPDEMGNTLLNFEIVEFIVAKN